jgi:hypothetical protein
VPGINIPAVIRQRIDDAGDAAPLEGMEIAQELLMGIKDMAQGVYIMPAFGRYDLVAGVVDVLGRTQPVQP